MASPLDDQIAKARASGYSDDEINSYLAGKRQEAKAAGYSDSEIDGYLQPKLAGNEYPNLSGSITGYLTGHIVKAASDAWNTWKSDFEASHDERYEPDFWARQKQLFQSYIAAGKLATVDTFNLATGGVLNLANEMATDALTKGMYAVSPKGTDYDQLHQQVSQDLWALAPEKGAVIAKAGFPAAEAPVYRNLVSGRAALATMKTGDPAAIADTDHITTNLAAAWAKTGEDPLSLVQRAQTDPVLREQLISPQPKEPPSGSSVTKTDEGDLVVPKTEGATPPPPEKPPETPPPSEPPEPPKDSGEALDRIGARIVRATQQRPTFQDFVNQAYDQFLDDQGPWKRLLAAAREGKPVEDFNNAEALQSLASGSRGVGRYQIETGQTNLAGDKIGPSLKEILSPIEKGDDFTKFEQYAAGRRAAELRDRGIETPFSGLDDAVRMVESDTALKTKYEGVFQQLVNFQNNSLKLLHEGGLLSDSSLNKIMAQNESRIPFRPAETGKGPAGAGGTVYQPVKSIKGGDYDILSPIEQIMRQTFTRTELAVRNVANRSLIDELEPAGFATRGSRATQIRLSPEELDSIIAENGGQMSDDFEASVFRHLKYPLTDDQLPVFEDGKMTPYTLSDPDAAKALRGMGRAGANLWARAMRGFASIQRAGIVLNPAFSIRQIFYDLPFQAIITPGLRNTPADFVQGILAPFTKPDLLDEYMRSGAWRPAFDQVGDRYIKTQIDKYYGETDFFGGMRNTLRIPLQGLRAFADYVYQAQRRGRFVREKEAGASTFAAATAEANEAREAALRASKSQKAAAEAAEKRAENKALGLKISPARQAQLATFHTGEKGSFAAQVNQIQPFFSAYLNGWKRLGEAMAERPAETAGKAAALITVPVLMNYLAYKDEDWYREAPDYKKDMGVLLPPSHAGGDPYFIPVIPGLSVIFGALPRRILESAIEGRAFDYGGYLKDAAKELIPWQATYSAAMPLVENMANYSFFRGRPLISPDAREQRNAPEQYTPYTSEAAKAISRTVDDIPLLRNFNLAPWQIDNVVRGWSGSLGQAAMNVAGRFLKPPSGEAPEPKESDSPWFGSFSVRYPDAQATSIQNFEDRYRQLEKDHGSLDQALRFNDIGRYQELAARTPAATLAPNKMKNLGTDARAAVLTIQGNRQFGLVPVLSQVKRDKAGLDTALKMATAVREDPHISAHDKRQLIDQFYGQAAVIARQANTLMDALGQ